jgi:hypothetical protein
MTDCGKEASSENESKMRNFENFKNCSKNGKDQERRGETRRDETRQSEAKSSQMKLNKAKRSETRLGPCF